MKRFTFLPMALMFLAGSLAFAQTDYTGYSDDEDAAFAELDNESVTVKEASPVTTAPATPKEETWEDAWQKRRKNVSLFMGFFPMSSFADIFVDLFDGEDDKDPDFTAYSVSIGYELFYLLEVGLMVDYTTVARSPVIAVVPRIKLNWLNFQYFRLYSYGGLGGIFWDGGGYVMCNFALVGFEVGNHLSLFFEGGWGQVGLLTMGVKVAF